MQTGDLVWFEAARGRSRRNAGTEQRLAGVDIPNARNDALVQQFDLDRLRRAFERDGKSFDGKLISQRLGA